MARSSEPGVGLIVLAAGCFGWIARDNRAGRDSAGQGEAFGGPPVSGSSTLLNRNRLSLFGRRRRDRSVPQAPFLEESCKVEVDSRSSARTGTRRKGIVLAGGTGKRLFPITSVVNKQLLPVYDKPLVYYPISTLMLAGIRQILVITTPQGRPWFEALLGDGSAWGVQFSYEVQPRPEGIAQAFLIAKSFLAGDPCALVLGDNIFFGNSLVERLDRASSRASGATVFGYHVEQPEAYGVFSFDPQGRVTGIVEKPEKAPSKYAVTGLYFFDGRVSEMAEGLQPSARGELEITDLNLLYLERGELNVELLGRGFAWLDAGTPESLLDASDFVRTLELRQGMKASCPEEVAFRMGYIDAGRLSRLADSIGDHPYGEYLRRLADEPLWEGDGARPPIAGPGRSLLEP